MAIPQHFIDELTARADIVEIVGDYVPLNPKGGSWWGLCPFHAEKSPSFHVVREKQMYHCFGCGKGGGVINFVMEMERLSYPDAIRVLAGKLGLPVPEDEDNGDQRKHRAHLLALNRDAARFYYDQLKNRSGARVEDYIRQRRIAPKTATRFGLGAAPDAWDELIRAMTERGYEKRDLLDAGLAVTNKTGGLYDKFRNRLMLPVIDLRGDVIGFTSRVMDNSTPKYLNTPETELFRKRSILYGLNYAKTTKRPNLILVEGNIDVITLHQAGFDNAVATMGTALTEEHARMLAKYSKELVICYDNDPAGKDATQRALAILKHAEFNVRVLQLPMRRNETGELVKQDADDFIKNHGAAAFERHLSESEEKNDYRLGTLAQNYDLTGDQGRLEFLKAAVGLIAGLDSSIEREIYGGKAAAIAGVTGNAVAHEVERQRKTQFRRDRRQEERKYLAPTVNLQPKQRELRYNNIRSAMAEEGILRLMLLDPTLFRGIPDLTGQRFSAPLLGKAFDLLKDRWERSLDAGLMNLQGEMTSEEMSHLVHIASKPESLANGRQALADYIGIIDTETLKQAGSGDADPLLAAWEMFQEKKAMEEKR
ncbi:MAG: primase [Oscillospiraceae bacterium]|nr:primase [Oscillospiraceae bacterium]